LVIFATVATAEWSPTGKVMRIEFKGMTRANYWPVAFVNVRPALDKKFEGNAAEKLIGKTVRITGKLTTYTSRIDPKSVRPEVVLDSADQIDIFETK